MARSRELCYTCHAPHAKLTTDIQSQLRKLGVTWDELSAIADELDSEILLRPLVGPRAVFPGLITALEDSDFTPEQITQVKTELQGEFGAPEDDPDDPSYIPAPFKLDDLDAAKAQAAKDARKAQLARQQQARFRQAHPERNREYQRRYREKKAKEAKKGA